MKCPFSPAAWIGGLFAALLLLSTGCGPDPHATSDLHDCLLRRRAFYHVLSWPLFHRRGKRSAATQGQRFRWVDAHAAFARRRLGQV